MKNGKLYRMALKAGLGLVSSALIGYMIKGEKYLGEKIDARYES